MNFFTSVFSDDPDPSDNRNQSQDEPGGDSERRSDPSGSGAWEFGGLWKTLSARSESIMEIYRRDLQEFGTGLKKEIEVAHGSLETVGHVIDHFGAQIISHGREAILLNSDSDNNRHNPAAEKSLNSRRYSRFDSQVRAIQGDVSTYSEVPENLDEYNKWKSGFSLEGESEEMEGFLRENEAMESVYKRVVPNTIDHDTFWYRYYYRVYKFKKDEDVRARLVRRMSREEEELSWDVEEGDGRVGVGDENKEKEGFSELHKSGEEGSKEGKRDDLLQRKGLDDSVEESKVDKSKEVVEKMGDGSKKSINEVDNRHDSGMKVIMERKVDDGKDSVVANQHSANQNVTSL